MNAAMDIINHGHYMGWELPKGCNVVLSANPEDKDYQVSYLDDAQKTRFFNFNVEFDIEYYLDNLRNENYNPIFIEYILTNHNEIFSHKVNDKNNGMISTPRQWTKLFSSLIDLKEFSSDESKARILENAAGIMDITLASNFITTINSEILTIPSIDTILQHEDYKKEFVNIIGKYKTDDYKIDKANIICSRLIAYLIENINKNYSLCMEVLRFFRDKEVVSVDKIFSMYNRLYKNTTFTEKVTKENDLNDLLKIIIN